LENGLPPTRLTALPIVNLASLPLDPRRRAFTRTNHRPEASGPQSLAFTLGSCTLRNLFFQAVTRF
jgi:hypothetical protein